MTSAESLSQTGAPWDASKNLTVVITSGSGGTGFIGVQLVSEQGWWYRVQGQGLGLRFRVDGIGGYRV